jgi:two-component system, OmpR family, response regulator ResD
MEKQFEKKQKILVVDDETRIRDLLRIVLESRGYGVIEAKDGQEAVQSVRDLEPDLIILDVLMPNLNGFESLKQIRRFSDCPVIMLTAKGEDYDQLEGFDSGADDYVIKPFTPMVLEARVTALLKRSAKDEVRTSYGDLRIDEMARQVWVSETEAALNRKEFDLLSYFAKNENISLNRDQILEKVWGYDYLGTSSTVDSHINRLRGKLGECGKYIKTLRGYGYRFEVKQ